jgi:hypothetical protein
MVIFQILANNPLFLYCKKRYLIHAQALSVISKKDAKISILKA